MAYNTPPTKNTGDTFSASEFNTYIRDNMAAGVPDIFAAAGDLAVGSGNDAAVRLAKGVDGDLLRITDAGAVAWGGIVARRVGGSSTVWNTAGSSVYVPTRAVIQMGVVNITINDPAVTGNATVNFPLNYSQLPLVLATMYMGGSVVGGFAASVMATAINVGQVAFLIQFSKPLGVNTTIPVTWMAIGPM